MSERHQPVKTYSSRFLMSVGIIAFAALTMRVNGQTKRAVCTQQTIDKLEEESDTIRDWPKLHDFYNRYGICGVDDAEVTEGVSESVVRIFIDHWDSLPVADSLFRHDPAFESFALAGLNVTDLTEDLNHIDRLASQQCQTNLHPLCAKIRKSIRTNK